MRSRFRARAHFPPGRIPALLRRPRLLIVGCGDIGARIVARLGARFRVTGLVASAEGARRTRAAGARAFLADLDRPLPRGRLPVPAPYVLFLAPTSPGGVRDERLRRALAAIRPLERRRMVYLSTTGVYGDRGGAWIDETARPAPSNGRSARRLEAERRARASAWRAAVLRVPGIYAADRLPLERLRSGLPAPIPEEDVYTNHIHADDLARACVLALMRGRAARVVNVVDDTELRMGEYLDLVADRFALARAPRMARAQLAAAVGAQRLSFLVESRRIRNGRMKRELRMRLMYPDVFAGVPSR